ncbi:uncharacterized protein C2orf73 homolog isoform X2 [Mizuhopecten yessoensis]|uniref:Uncharacterized protein n=1 Tax=Mizuhopecten yessoensis TaxID=6573 RepID=A0A210PGZ3_MIZYE|nr:uncharacterized protein C2orf73 homolog isoform X2 [Mizuhopecten yessoensis]OWF35737.1 hypothetical protein KP79_PYT10575 [Mizuhopecten yessoensis]
MTMYMPPIARKKRVSGHYDPDSFRVISGDAEEMHPKFVTTSIEDHADFRRETPAGGLTLPNIYNRQTEVLPKSVPDYRVNRPHPGSCGFLRHNVRVLNEPVCSVYTASSHDEQNLWWPSRTSNEPLNVPPKTKDTVYRGDYMQDGDRIQSSGSTRHSANLHRDPALGTVPVNFLPARNDNKRFFKEKISYEHQYNSRLNPNYPTRAKRHGSFVWDQMSNAESKQMMEEQTALNEAECKENAQSQTHPRPISNTTSSSAPPPSQQDSTPPTEVVPEKKTVTFQSPIDKENEKIHK